MKRLATLSLTLLLAGLSSAQKTEWVKTITEQASEIAPDHQIAIDHQDNQFIALSFKHVVRFGRDLILKAKSQTGEFDAVLAKLDAEGKLIQWTVHLNSFGNVQIKDLALDQHGNAVVVGSFQQDTDFGGMHLIPKGKTGFFIAKYTPNGALMWVKQGGSYSTKFPTASDGKSVCIDGDGNISVAAHVMGMYDQWVMDNNVPVEDRYRGKGYYENQELTELYTGNSTLLIKLDGAGYLLWLKTSGVNFYANALAADKLGNIYCTGSWINVSSFCGKQLQSNGLQDIFVTKLSASGEMLWFNQFGRGIPYSANSPDMDLERGEHIAVDHLGNVFFGGVHFDKARFGDITKSSDAFIGNVELGTFFVGNLDAEGRVKWIQSAVSNSGSVLNGLTADRSGNAYASAVLYFKKGTFAGNNVKGAFIAKLDSDGLLVWSDDADDRKGRVKVTVMQPGSIALSHDESYLLQTGNALEVASSRGFNTISTSTGTIIAVSKVRTE